MKKIMFLCSFALLSITAYADGEITTLEAKNLKSITFDGDKVNVQFSDGTAAAQYDMEAIVIDFSTVTSVEERMAVSRAKGLEGKPVYNLKGEKVGDSAARMVKGVYVVDGKKVIVK